jgi:putative transposase
MKKSRWSEEQIIKILQEAEAGTDIIQNICRKHAVSEQSFYRC